MTTDFSRVSFDVESMKMTATTFARKLAVLKTYRSSGVSTPEKLRVNRSILQVDDRYAQGFRRWFDGDSREELCRYMKSELNDYRLFLNMITIALNHDRLNVDLISVRDRSVALCETICPAFRSLMLLYPDYEMFTSCMEAAEDTLNQFLQRHLEESATPPIRIAHLLGRSPR